ncbi:MAG: hypothetical protein WCG47_11155 [Dermatophilaceae bacterium]
MTITEAAPQQPAAAVPAAETTPGAATAATDTTVVLVFGVHHHVGASVAALAMAEAADELGLATLLIDAAPVPTSGLLMACATSGARVAPGSPVRACTRGGVQVRSLADTSRSARCPQFADWTVECEVELIVVDLGVTAEEAHGGPQACPWLRLPPAGLVLVAPPTRPGLQRVESLLSRWERDPAALVHLGAATPKVVDTAGARTRQLLGQAITMPHDPAVHALGVTPAALPGALRAAGGQILHRATAASPHIHGRTRPPSTAPPRRHRFLPQKGPASP